MSRKIKELSEDLLLKIKDLYDQEYGYKKIAVLLGIPCCQVIKAYKILSLGGKRTKKLKYENITEICCNRCNVVKHVTEFKQGKENGRKVYRPDCITCYKQYRYELYHNIKTRKTVEEIKQEKIFKIKELAGKGFSLNKIITLINMNSSTVKNYAKEAGIKLLSKQDIIYTEDKINKIKELHDLGYSTRKIAKEFNVRYEQIYKIYKKLGIQTKNWTAADITEQICNTCKIIASVDNFIFKVKNGKKFYDKQCKNCRNKYLAELKKRNNPNYKSLELRLKDLSDKIKDLNDRGLSTRKIATELDINVKTVKIHLNRLGIDLSQRKPPKTAHLRKEKVCPKCPESGSQPIENFKPCKGRNGNIHWKYCIICQRKNDIAYKKERCKKSEVFRLRRSISGAITGSLKRRGGTKNGESSFKHLPYSVNELKAYIESKFEHWMNWNNRGNYIPEKWDDNDQSTWTWQLDHIIPQSDLPFTSLQDENFQKCWALCNLRPLSAKQNYLDGTTRIRHKIKYNKKSIK